VGWEVRSFASPQTFLSAVSPADHGCIVADLLMPEMTGLQLHRELRSKGARLPIIVVTGHADAGTCRAALRDGVFDFVEKSFTPHDLLVVIRSAIKKDAEQSMERRQRSELLTQFERLSPREREVMQSLSDGMTLKAIAAQFGISVQTASKHRSNLFDKLGVRNEVELVKLLYRIDPPVHRVPGPTVPDPDSSMLTTGPGFPAPGHAPAAENG
jgi:RNA polymerase sigma factor (sigma-70 family)